jgi:hypothetical protein
MTSSEVYEEEINEFYDFLSSKNIGLKINRDLSIFEKFKDKKEEKIKDNNSKEKYSKENEEKEKKLAYKDKGSNNKKNSHIYKIYDNNNYTDLLKTISISNEEINEFIKNKMKYDPIISYEFVISMAIYKSKKGKLDYTFFDKKFFDSKSKSLANKFSRLYFNHFSYEDLNLSRKDLPYLTSQEELASEIKIFFLNKLGFLKNKEIPSLYEAYRIYKFAYREVKDHLIKKNLIPSYNKINAHIIHLEKIIKSKIKDEEALKEIKLLLKNSFRGLDIYSEKINEDDSDNEELNFENNEEEYKDNNKLINQESEIFQKINEGLKKYNLSISLKEFDEALKLNMNNYNFSLDQNLDGIDGNNNLLDTMSSENKEADIANEQSQIELLKALFSLFVNNNENKKIYRRKLYILFLEYILNMSNEDIANSIGDSKASVSLAKKDLISDFSYLTERKLNSYLDDWLNKYDDFKEIKKDDLLNKLAEFDKKADSYKDNLNSYFENKKISDYNKDLFIQVLLNFKISEGIRNLSQEEKNIISSLDPKQLKGKQLEPFSQKDKILLLLRKFENKSDLLRETFNFNPEDFKSFIEFSEKSLSDKFSNIQSLWFQNIEQLNKESKNINKDIFFLLVSLFSKAKLEKIEKDKDCFIKFNSYNSFDDFKKGNVLKDLISSIDKENNDLKFGKLQGVSNAR